MKSPPRAAKKRPKRTVRDIILQPSPEVAKQASTIARLIAEDIGQMSGISPMLWDSEEYRDKIKQRWALLAVGVLTGLL